MGKAFEKISAGLEDAIKHASGQKSKVVVHKPEIMFQAPYLLTGIIIRSVY